MVFTLLTHDTTMLLGKSPLSPQGEVAHPRLLQKSDSEACGRGICMGMGVGNVRATDCRKEFLDKARRVRHVF